MDKDNQYIKNSIYLNLQKKEISELMSKQIRKDIYKLKLINKDIIDEYLNPQLNEIINSFLNKENKKASEFSDQEINNIINNIIMKDKKFNFENEELILDFLYPEELKMNNLEIPNNFFIISEIRFNKMFENNGNLTDFKTYDALIGKEGIFLWTEGIKTTKIMYFIENNDDLKINIIFLYKSEKEFKNQLKDIFEKGKHKYFKERSIIKKKVGIYYNIISRGNIIGEYINVAKNVKEKDIQISNADLNYELIEGERIESEISRIEEKEELIEIFLPYLIICFTKIEKLKKGLEENNKDIKGILKSLSKIINSVNNNKINDISKNIYKMLK